jgi:hypothetical protein
MPSLVVQDGVAMIGKGIERIRESELLNWVEKLHFSCRINAK